MNNFIFSKEDKKFMEKAIELAKEGEKKGDIPIGAIVVNNEKEIIGKGFNQKHLTKDALMHAEIVALKEASSNIGDWRLNHCTMYVTAEPCIMCAGAILHFRLKEVVFGVKEPKFGGVITKASIFDINSLNHKVSYRYGLMEEEIIELMKNFFKKLRISKRKM
jgi:tRNA(adenine34) deaminase